MTADAMPEDVARCLAAGLNAHLAKPVNHVLLIETVGRSLEAGAQRPAAAAAG
jgi:CheY-like chemotaxis protein